MQSFRQFVHETLSPVEWLKTQCPRTDRPASTSFLLPDGSRLHTNQAHDRAAGMQLPAVLAAGVVRVVPYVGIEVAQGRLNDRQARTIIDDWLLYRDTLSVDVVDTDSRRTLLRTKVFDVPNDEIDAEGLRGYVNRQSETVAPFAAFVAESVIHSKSDLEDALADEQPTDYGAFLTAHGVRFTTVQSVDRRRTLFVFTLGSTPYVMEDDDDSPKNAEDWLVNVDAEDWVELPDFNREFWSSPSTLYHATPSAQVASILAHGLEARSTTRGMSNRSVGAAVFAVSDPDMLADGSYGDGIIAIDCGAMKRAGVTPVVEQEPSVATHAATAALAWKIGLRDYESGEGDWAGEWDDTIIIHGSIHPKFLTVYGE